MIGLSAVCRPWAVEDADLRHARISAHTTHTKEYPEGGRGAQLVIILANRTRDPRLQYGDIVFTRNDMRDEALSEAACHCFPHLAAHPQLCL